MEPNMLPSDILNVMREQLAMLTEQLKRKDVEIERLNQIILNLQRARFGRSSERQCYVLPEGMEQLSFFEARKDAPSIPAEEAHPVHVAEHTRKKKRTQEEMFAALPHEERIIDLPESEKVNGYGEPMVRIGREKLRSELHLRRQEAKVVDIYRYVYADQASEERCGESEVLKPKVPPALLEHSYVSASLATDVIVRKYADGLPLYRQEQIWKRMGVPLKRNTMANWIIQISQRYLKPLWFGMKAELLTQRVIHADETPLQVLKEEGRPPDSKSYMWVYASSKQAERQVRIFEYRDSRAGANADEFLENYNGVLISDGFSGYNKVKGVMRAGCWAHMRRKWHEAMPKGATVQNSKAAQGYACCNKLFSLERKFEGLSPEERRAQRELKSRPLVDEYWSWLEDIWKPEGKLKEAVTYARNQREYLCAFLEHGEAEISNNQAENAIRPFVVGRKGWLFADTPEGAEASAIIYSLVETAKANHLRLDDYLEFLLTVLPERFAQSCSPDISIFLPWQEAICRRFKTP